MVRFSHKHYRDGVARVSDLYPLLDPNLQQRREALYESAVRRYGPPCGPQNGFKTLLGSGYTGPSKPLFGDHLEIFGKGIARVLIAHLYPQNYTSLKREIEKFCAEEGLQFEVLDESWHVPGWTVAILFSRKNQISSNLSDEPNLVRFPH